MINIELYPAEGDRIARRFEKNRFGNASIGKPLVVNEPSAQQQGMHARRPLVMITRNDDRILIFIERKIRPHALMPVVILEIIARVVVLKLRQEQYRIVRGELLFESGVPFEARKLVVRTNPIVVLIIQVECIADAVEGPELREP